VIKFDPGLSRIYVAVIAAIAVFHQDDPDHYRKLEDSRAACRAHGGRRSQDPSSLHAEQEEDGKPVARMWLYEAVTN